MTAFPLLHLREADYHLVFLYLYTALLPNSSSMRSNWLYLVMRSERLNEPILICPLLVAMAMSAMVASSVSP